MLATCYNGTKKKFLNANDSYLLSSHFISKKIKYFITIYFFFFLSRIDLRLLLKENNYYYNF